MFKSPNIPNVCPFLGEFPPSFAPIRPASGPASQPVPCGPDGTPRPNSSLFALRKIGSEAGQYL